MITGFILLLPAIATIYILQLLFSLIDRFLGEFITNILKTVGVLKRQGDYLYFLGIYTPFSERLIGIGFILTLIIISAIGFFHTKEKQSYFDRVDVFFRKIPIANYIYSSVEQMIHAFTQERSSFKKVVMIEYPRKGMFTLGFLTGESKGEVQRRTNKECINVFLPTTPNPTSGWLVLVPVEDVTLLDMTVEQGLKFIITGGVVVPPDKHLSEQQERIETEERKEESELVINIRKKRKEDQDG
ncbi:MAG: DUF502 domain-containing protein [Bacillaceae bacterium]|nr:DUF502 domain-containing protein [Bacillaceae bacterium]